MAARRPRGRRADPSALKERAAAWAQAQTYTVGRRCSICTNAKLLYFTDSIVKLWADGKVKVNALSWPKVSKAVQEEFDTRTHWYSIREHYRNDDPKLYERVERRRRGET